MSDSAVQETRQEVNNTVMSYETLLNCLCLEIRLLTPDVCFGWLIALGVADC